MFLDTCTPLFPDTAFITTSLSAVALIASCFVSSFIGTTLKYKSPFNCPLSTKPCTDSFGTETIAPFVSISRFTFPLESADNVSLGILICVSDTSVSASVATILAVSFPSLARAAIVSCALSAV